MAIELNKQPYFDDFDKSKNFMKVLFKPSRPVQVRELNQIQSIQKNQLENFANHVFKNGSKVEGHGPSSIKTDFVTIRSISPYNNAGIDISKLQLNEVFFRGRNNSVEARLIHVVSEILNISPFTLYINYTKTGADNLTILFEDNEIVDVIDKNAVLIYSFQIRCTDIICSNYSTAYLDYPVMGKATIWQIPESIYYINGYFIEVPDSILVGESYNSGIESYSIGFDVEEEVVDTDDPIEGQYLFDNALGYPNQSAPGADRLKINLVLAKRSLDATQNENFILLAKVEDGIPTYIKTRSDYSVLMDTLAERTYDESGNYTVTPVTIKFRDHLKKSEYDTYGLFYPKIPGETDGSRIFGDENKFVAIISPLKAYIKGFLTETIAESKILLDKARDVASIKEFYDRFDSLNYILISLDDKSLLTPNDSYLDATKFDTNIFTNIPVVLKSGSVVNNEATGTSIGSMTIYDIEYDKTVSGTKLYRAYFTNITMSGNNTLNLVRSIDSTLNNKFVASPYLTTYAGGDTGVSIYNNDKKTLIFNLGKSNVKSIKNVDDNSHGIDYAVKRRLPSIVNDGFVTFSPIGGEVFDNHSSASSFIHIVSATRDLDTVIEFSDEHIELNSITVPVDPSKNALQAILYHKCIKKNAPHKIKTITYTTLSGQSISNGVITLSGYTDLIAIDTIMQGSTDVTGNFVPFDGQTDTAFVPITLTTSESYANGTAFNVSFYYYQHTGVGDYFSIDSYKNIIDDESIIFGYEDVPSYRSVDGTIFKMSDCLDFRPTIMSSAKLKVNQPALNGIFNNDITYYLPRVDYIVLNKNGEIYQKKGVSSETPKPPKLSEDDSEMALMLLKQKSYVYDVKLDVIKNKIENKRYTMRDIGKLEKRINDLEYYTSFTLLEMQTETSSVKDADGIDRYKNGFIAENFKDFLIGDIQNTEFRASHDNKNQELRPAAFPYNTNLELIELPDTSINYKKIDNKIIIDYDEEAFIVQPFSSKSISLNPYFVFNRKGIMQLLPNCDNWVDTKYEPELSVTIDTGIENLLPVEPIIETYWGEWNTMSEVMVSSSTTVSTTDNQQAIWRGWIWHGGWQAATETTKITTDIYAASQQRTGTEITTTFDTRVDQLDLGTRVTDIELMSYARPTNVLFAAGNLKPKTKLYAFFDDENVSEYCIPWAENAKIGDQLISDTDGFILGAFIIPENRFFTGQKIFRLTNEIENNKDQDSLLTSAEAKFWSGGLSLTKQGTTLNVNGFDMSIAEEQLTQNQVVVDVTTTIETTQVPYDPLAQTFFNEESCFITSIDVFFESVDTTDNIWVQIKNVDNGYPGPTIIGESFKHGSQIVTSDDASKETRISFPFPVFIEGGKEYAIVIGSHTPESRIWCSLLGQPDKTNPDLLINTQTSLGSLFKGQNNSTWTASQFEDMKITINRARFKYDYLRAMLQNTPSNETINIIDPFETESGFSEVRITARNHGMLVNDSVKFNIGEKMRLNFTINSGGKGLFEGQIIEAYDGANLTGSAKIANVTVTDVTVDEVVTTTASCELIDVVGFFTVNKTIKAKAGALSYTGLVQTYDATLSFISPIGSIPETPTYNNDIIGTITSLYSASGAQYNTSSPEDINGIPISILTGNTLKVLAVDSIDTFVIDVGENATSSGYAGGSVQFGINRKYELFNINGAYSNIGCDEYWTYYGIGHESNELFINDNYNRLQGKPFKPFTDVFLNQPYKFVYDNNNTLINDEFKSSLIVAEFQASTPYVSPVLDISTFSTILVSNRVDFINESEVNIAPTASDRFVSETDPLLGSEVYKYVTKNIVLKNPALDIKFFLDVYKPTYTDFDIYIKVQPTWDYSEIGTKDWILIDPIWKDFTSKDLTNYREIEFVTNEIMPETFGSGAGAIGEFSSFKIKIVGKARNSANPPLFKRLRAIAIT